MSPMRHGTPVLLVAALSCACSNSVAIQPNSWEARYPSSTQRSSYPLVPFVAVAETERDSAIELLAFAAYLSISAEDAARLTGAKTSGGRHYLVRGLCVGCFTGTFSVHLAGTELVIGHSGIAPAGREATRWPIVVSLDTPPTRVYVQCHGVG